MNRLKRILVMATGMFLIIAINNIRTFSIEFFVTMTGVSLILASTFFEERR